MWPSQRLASIDLESWQGKAQARRRERRPRGIRPIVTLLEERALLSQLPGTWATIAPLPNDPGGYHNVVTARGPNGLIYAFGGGGPGEVDAYNPTTNAWSVVASSPTGHTYSAAVTGPDGRIYAIGSAIDAYSPITNSWTSLTNQPNWQIAAVMGPDGRIYVIGGGNAQQSITSTVSAYNIATNSWASVASMPRARVEPAATVGINGLIYVMGGYINGTEGAISEVDAYNPATNSWTVEPSLPAARGGLAAVTGPDGLIYAIGGRFGYSDSHYSSEVDTYSSTTNTWSTIASLPNTRELPGAAVGTDGRIYVVGGNLNTSNGQTSEADAYVPVPPYLHKVTPITSWPNPAGIAYGTVLGPTQLDATASVPGTFTYSPLAGTVLQAGANSNLSATFTPTDTADYNSVTLSTAINVTPVPLTVTANNEAKVYGSPLPQLSASYSGFVNGDTAANLTTPPTLATTASASRNVGGYPITASGASDPDYSISYIDGTLTVNAAPLTVTAANKSMTYGGAVPVLTYTYTGLVNSDTSATFSGGLATTTTSSSSVGDYPITVGTLAATGNYTIGTFNPGTLTVNAAPLTITANNDSKTYGTLKTFSSTAFTASDLVNGDTITGVTETSTGAPASATVGTYNIVPSAATGTGLSNYTISYVDGTLTVNPASLLSLTVTTLADDPNGPISGQTTLRDAITQANADTTDSQEVISFAPGLQGMIDLTTALPNLANNISINGPGASALTVQLDSSAISGVVFTVNSGETASISGLTISEGRIVNNGTLTMNNSTLTGSGISNASTGTGICLLTATNCIFANDSGSDNGGISNFYTMVNNEPVYGATANVTNCTFENDSAYYGGGILNYADTLSVSNSSFINDSAACGGGIYNFAGTATVTNSTFTDDSASQTGGGVCSSWTNAMLTNCTIDGNSAPAGYGGGIWADVTLNNTIVAGNTGGDIDGQVAPISSNNLIGDGTGITTVLNSSSLVGTTANPINPMLGPLANNGGPTQTMAPMPGSPSINRGNVALAVDPNGVLLQYDQRGPGYPRTINETVNIGAYEGQATPGVIWIAPDITPNGQNAVIVNINTDSDASGNPAAVNENVYACPFNIIDTNGVTHTDDALSVDLDYNVGLGYTSVQPIAISLASASSPTWPGYNPDFNSGQGNELAWLEQALTNAKSQPGGATADQYAALQIEAWSIIDPNFTWSYAGGGGNQADLQNDVNALQTLLTAGPEAPGGPPAASFAGTQNYVGAVAPGTLLALDPGANGSQYQNLITPADSTLGVYGALATINVIGYNVTYDGQAHTATGTATAADGTNLSQYLDLTQTTHINSSGIAGPYSDTWTFDDPGVYPVESGVVNDTILQANATINVAPASGLVYNGQYQALGTGTATGINGINLTSDLGFAMQVNAGTYSTTDTYPSNSPVNYWYFTDPSGNYAHEQGVLTTTIAQANATIDITPISGLVYNGSQQVTATGTVTGVNGLILSSSDLTISATHTNAGTYTDSWFFTDPNGNYAPETGNMTDTIAQAPLGISASRSTKVYDGTTTVTNGATPAVSGLYGSDTVTGLTESFVSPNAGSEATQVNPGFTINDGNGGNNYYVADINQGTGYIFPGEPTIVVADSGGAYNGTPYAATVTINGGSTLETVSPTTFYNQFNATTNTWNTTGDVAPTNVGAYQAWVYFPGSQDWNQETTSPVSFDITPAHVTVDVAPNVTGYKMVYNGAPSFTGTVTGQVPSGNPDMLGYTASIESPVWSGAGNLAVGTYTVQAGLTGSNLNDYSVSYVNSSLTVTPAALIVTTASESKVYGTTLTLPTPTEIGLISGDNVTLSASSVGAGPTANVGVYTINGAASGSDLGDYAVTYVNGNLTVTPTSFSVSIPPQVYIYGQPEPILPITITGPLGTPFQPNFIVDASPINAGVYEIPVTFNAPEGIAQPDGLPGSYNPNYQTVTAYEQITIVSAPLTITANPDSGALWNHTPFGSEWCILHRLHVWTELVCSEHAGNRDYHCNIH